MQKAEFLSLVGSWKGKYCLVSAVFESFANLRIRLELETVAVNELVFKGRPPREGATFDLTGFCTFNAKEVPKLLADDPDFGFLEGVSIKREGLEIAIFLLR